MSERRAIGQSRGMGRWAGLLSLAGSVSLAFSASAEAPTEPPPAEAPGAAGAPTLASEMAKSPPSESRSKVPTAEEWRTATSVKLSRTSPRAAACAAVRVREWLRVRCPMEAFAVSLLGGANDGLSFWIGEDTRGTFGEVQLALRPGDRRVVQLWTTRTGTGGVAIVEPSVVLQELWILGEASPTVTVL